MMEYIILTLDFSIITNGEVWGGGGLASPPPQVGHFNCPLIILKQLITNETASGVAELVHSTWQLLNQYICIL